MLRKLIGGFVVVLCLFTACGCALAHLAGGMAQNAEYQKLLDVLPEYADLENKTVAVLVNSDMATLYENPRLSLQIAGGMSVRLQKNVPGIRVMNPDAVLAWQFNTTQWNAMPYGDLVALLNVDRIVYVDVYEYRLHPRGDSWLWEGVCAATIGIIERNYIDPDNFSHSSDVTTMFPNIRSVTRDELRQEQVEFGLLSLFIRSSTWLFHRHLEPKYPERYQGTIPEQPAT